MTRRNVVPTLDAPALKHQTLGRFHGASSESRVSIHTFCNGQLLRGKAASCRLPELLPSLLPPGTSARRGSVMPGNRRRSSIAAENSPRCRRRVESLPAHPQGLLLRMARRRPRCQHAEDRSNDQIDPQKDERGGDGLDRVPQGQPSRCLGQCQNGQGKYQGDYGEGRAPFLARHHRAQAQQLGVKRHLKQINASPGAAPEVARFYGTVWRLC